MKKIILFVALIFSAMYTMAQDEQVINLYVQQKQYEKAKEQVDKWLSDSKIKPKDKQTALLWKMMVYSNLYADSALTSKYPDANTEALDAFNQYKDLDPTLKQLKDQSFFASGIGSLYSGSFEKGKNFFQAKQWDSAFKYFSESEGLGTFLLENKLSTSTATVDTLTVLYTAYAAQNSKHMDTAVKYYSKLADIKVGGPDYEDIYKFLIEYNSQQKNDTAFKKYLAIAKEVYPNDNAAWSQYEMSAMTANASLPELLQKYQQDAAAGGMSEDKLITYAEALATTDKAQLDPLDSTQQVAIKLAAAQAFEKAFALNDTMGLYAFNSGVIYYGIYSDLDDRYSANRGEGAALKAKRDAISKDETAYADTASEWLEKAYPILKAKQDRTKPETASLNRTVDYLANIYYWKRDQTKTNGNSKDYDKYDALYKQYDAEHNSYK
ncbi:MAG: hypothetical protein ABJB05_00250 [Parafilimonas sp.]